LKLLSNSKAWAEANGEYKQSKTAEEPIDRALSNFINVLVFFDGAQHGYQWEYSPQRYTRLGARYHWWLLEIIDNNELEITR
jgi:hypothetical protein